MNSIVFLSNLLPYFSSSLPHVSKSGVHIAVSIPASVRRIQQQAYNRAFGLMFRAHSIRCIYIRVDSNYCVRRHGWNTFPKGTSREENNKISITAASPQKIRPDSESYVSGSIIGIFPTPDKVVLPRKKTLREFLFDGPHSL